MKVDRINKTNIASYNLIHMYIHVYTCLEEFDVHSHGSIPPGKTKQKQTKTTQKKRQAKKQTVMLVRGELEL